MVHWSGSAPTRPGSTVPGLTARVAGRGGDVFDHRCSRPVCQHDRYLNRFGEMRHHLPVMPKTVARAVGIGAALVSWTFLVGSCAGIVTMSGAHTSSGEWPVGATVTLVLLALAWAGVPTVLWRRRRSAGH